MKASNSKVVLLENGSRRGYLPIILPLTRTSDTDNERVFMRSEVLYYTVATYFGFREIERKSGEILPFLPERLAGCDFQLSLELRDTILYPLEGAQQLLDTLGLVNDRNTGYSQIHTTTIHSNSTTPATNISTTTSSFNNKNNNDEPFAVLGALLSSTTQLLTTLGYPFELPIMSFGSTSRDLDYSPYFTRTVPTNAGDAMAIAAYLQHLGVTHVGIVYVTDVWGNAFHLALQSELNERDIVFLSAPYFDYRTASDAEASIERLARSQYRYFVAIVNLDTSTEIFHLAHQHGIMGYPGYSWILTEGNVGFGSVFRRDSDYEASVSRALHGAAKIQLQGHDNDKLRQSFADFASNESLQDEFINLFKEPDIFAESKHIFRKQFPLDGYHHFAFDAAIAMGIASCETPGQFTGDEFYQTLRQTTFEGVSGTVSFDESGTRAIDQVQFHVRNILLSDERSTPTHILFTSEISAEISVGDASTINVLRDFIYSDNSTTSPLPLPPVEEDLNPISQPFLIIGFLFGGLAVIASISCILWTYIHRNRGVVRSSQPFFLYQLGAGTTIMALAVIPLSFQEPISQYWLDVACMSIPWFLLIGFVTAYSAIFCKTLRLNKLLASAQAFRRIVIHPKDVMIPFLVLISFNTLLLLAWSFVDPMHWFRAEGTNYDLFGRSTESHGACRLGGSNHVYLCFVIPLAIVDLSVVLFALQQCHKARNVCFEYSESHYLFLSMASLWETLILAVPLLYATSDHPSAGFIVSTIIVTLLCFTVLIPMFVPKYMMLKGYKNINSNSSSNYYDINKQNQLHPQ